MASLEERVTALEACVDQLAQDQEYSGDIAVTAAREALTAREAHQKNIELLNALRKTQVEQGRTLAEHSRTLAEHTVRLDRIDTRLDTTAGQLDHIGGSLGVLTAGMHSIESLLTRHVDDEGEQPHS